MGHKEVDQLLQKCAFAWRECPECGGKGYFGPAAPQFGNRCPRCTDNYRTLGTGRIFALEGVREKCPGWVWIQAAHTLSVSIQMDYLEGKYGCTLFPNGVPTHGNGASDMEALLAAVKAALLAQGYTLGECHV